MRERTVARNYASALFELGQEHEEGEAYAAAFTALTETLVDRRVDRFLATPKVGVAEKEAVLRRTLEGRVPERFIRFVLVVVRKRRQDVLPLIAEEYRGMLDEHEGRIHASVTLAREPDAATEQVIAERLSAMLGKTVMPHITVNPEILGGLVVRFGDRAMDGSLRRQLLSLKREMMRASLPELPAGA